MGELMEEKGYFSLCKLILVLTPPLQICSAFRLLWGGHKTLPASVASPLPSAQNNPHAEVAYFGMAYSDPLHFALLFNCQKPKSSTASFCSHEEPPLRSSSKGASQTQRATAPGRCSYIPLPSRYSKRKLREEAPRPGRKPQKKQNWALGDSDPPQFPDKSLCLWGFSATLCSLRNALH